MTAQQLHLRSGDIGSIMTTRLMTATVNADSHAGPTSALDARMVRLSRLLGTDEGFYVLALHSFVESFIVDVVPSLRYFISFPALLWDFKDFLKAKGRVSPDDLQAINRISREHPTANKVRHGFLSLSKEEAVAASHNFLGFCRTCGIEHPFLATLSRTMEIWDEKVSPLEKSQELAKLTFDLFVAQRENRKLLQQAEAARDASAKAEQLNADLKLRTAELARERARVEGKGERVDALRAELNALAQQRKTLDEELAKFRDLDLYVEHLNRFTIYTRTRRDYERSLMRLTAEQQAALDGITLGHDFHVRGGAGTGKTIVLLHAYAKARKLLAEELGLERQSPEERGRVVLLTYTNTLVKYDRYLAALLKAPGGSGGSGGSGGGPEGGADLIQTADSFFLARLRAVDPSWKVDHDAVDKLCRRWPVDFMSAGELAVEVEDFLFGNLVSRAEYVDEVVVRHGMRQPLSRAQRARVWEAREQIVGAMEDMGTFSKSYSRIKLIEDREARSGDAGARAGTADVDFIFVDESQDLTSADLKALKLMCRRGVVMAGDAGQAIYGVGSPYKRAGIDISGRTRILRTDFRTTCPIHDLAEKYRELCEPDIEGGPVTTHAFREGPAPELYRAATREELLKLLVEKVSLFIEKLGYDPENVTVLAPGKGDVTAIQDRLGRRGITSANIRDDAFSFTAEGMVRVTTLHSSKGLDFPVVLLYLPSLPAGGEYDEKSSDALDRNLLYVAMTRAMDNLNVFVMEEPRERAVQELVGAIDGLAAP